MNNVEEKPFKTDIDIDKRRKNLNDLWSGATDGATAAGYLMDRGIPTDIIQNATDIRGNRGIYLYDGGKPVGIYPVMLSMIRNSKGEPISIHRTYIKPDGKEKKIMPPLESITGGCIRLGEPDDTLVLAEGVETALAAWSILGHPAWACISANNLENFTAIPRHVKKVIVCADNDHSFVGQAAAFRCAAYMRNRAKVETEVVMATIDGDDMLDHLNRKRPELALIRWRGNGP